jgi:hypothetical protein
VQAHSGGVGTDAEAAGDAHGVFTVQDAAFDDLALGRRQLG